MIAATVAISILALGTVVTAISIMSRSSNHSCFGSWLTQFVTWFTVSNTTGTVFVAGAGAIVELSVCQLLSVMYSV